MKTPVTNRYAVAVAWSDGLPARTGNHSFSSDGTTLRSYSLAIGTRTENGTRVVGDYTSGGGHYYSQTTSSHVGIAKSCADEIMHPEVYEATFPSINN